MATKEGPPKETLLEGVTFAEVLIRHGESKKVDVSQIPTGRTDLFFDRMDNPSISRDKQHALAVGYDQGRPSLVRDGQVVLSGDFDDIQFRADSVDYSEFTIVGVKREFGYTSFNVYQYSTTGEAVSNKPSECYDYTVPGEFFVEWVEAGPRGVPVVWQGWKPGCRGAKESVFVNQKLIAQGDHIQVQTSPDCSRVLTVAKNKNRTRVTIALNGECLLQGKYEAGNFGTTPNLDYAMVELLGKAGKNKGSVSLFILTPEGISDVKPFEKLDVLERTEDGHLRAVIRRDGRQRKILLPPEREESQPDAETDTSKSP